MEVKEFAHDFVNTLNIGPYDTQVGMITFGWEARINFYLNTYQNKRDVLQAINSTVSMGGRSNAADAICKLIQYGIYERNGARSGAIIRAVVFLTDGRSTEVSYECEQTTLQAAEELKKQIPQ